MISKNTVLGYLNAFGFNLRKLRNSLGMSYDQMERETGISKSILSRTENGHTAPSFETFLRLHLYFGVDTSFFRSHDAISHAAASEATQIFKPGSKFTRKNFTGRPAMSAEVEILKPSSKIELQSRRGFEENILVLCGTMSVLYLNKSQGTYEAGDLFTLNPNYQSYGLSSESGANLIRVSCPLAKDQSSVSPYLSVTEKK